MRIFLKVIYPIFQYSRVRQKKIKSLSSSQAAKMFCFLDTYIISRSHVEVYWMLPISSITCKVKLGPVPLYQYIKFYWIFNSFYLLYDPKILCSKMFLRCEKNLWNYQLINKVMNKSKSQHSNSDEEFEWHTHPFEVIVIYSSFILNLNY